MTAKKQRKVAPVPEGRRSLAPYLYVRGASRAMDFYARAFGATELFHMPAADGKVAHAEMQLGDSVLMLSDESAEAGTRSPETYGGTPASVFLYIADVDKVYQRAIDAGASPHLPPADMFWGDRLATFTDPFGHEWTIATHIENVSPDEMQRRATLAPQTQN